VSGHRPRNAQQYREVARQSVCVSKFDTFAINAECSQSSVIVVQGLVIADH